MRCSSGYAVAHYFSLLVFDGQQALRILSDPLATGADYFGTAERRVDYTVVSASVIAAVQVLAIVSAHVVAVVSAHDRAVPLLPPRAAVVGQYPLLAVMVLFTVGGISLGRPRGRHRAGGGAADRCLPTPGYLRRRGDTHAAD